VISPALRRDWTQFRLLSRDAVRQLIDTALFSRESDPMEFALWMLALVATPPAFFAARQIFTYTALVNADIAAVEQVALAHRLFFIIYGMLASTLLAAMTWDALFPDGRDQEIVGVLPVRPYTFAAARLGAAVIVGAGFAAAVNLPAGLIYSFIASGHPALGNVVALFAGHVLATMLGSLLVYFALLTLRGIAAILLGARAGAWLGAALQLLTVILLVEVFFFLPGVLGGLVDAMLGLDPRARWFPPVWFGSLNAWVAGDSHGIMRSGISTGVVAFISAAVITVPIYLLPARWLGRRALESRPREHATSITSIVRAMGKLTAARPAVRAILGYSVASLLRSRRHLLVIATYVGVAIAISVASILLIEIRGTIALETPDSWILALPLVFLFFVVLGLRASFRIPTEIEANWSFRLSQPTLNECVNGTALVMLTLAVVPIVALTAAITLPVWPLSDVLKIALMQIVAGVVLIECVLLAWAKVPFACGHAPSPDMLKAWWPAYLLAMYLYAFKQSHWQFAALGSARVMGVYLATAFAVVVLIRLIRRRKLRHQALEFDAAPVTTVEQLKLSEALN
jgi:hypothetical protein